MRLSSKGRYGIQAMFDLAYHGRGDAIQIKEIARRQAVPPRFLEQIFQELKRAGLVASKRGPRGGYALTVDAGDVRVGDIVRALEGPIELADENLADGDDVVSRKVVRSLFAQLATDIESCLDQVTLQQLCDRAEHVRGDSAVARRYVYSI